uniref:V-type proton ATPase subunit G n=1 Tax=Tetraselmis sp. GSL018 TaxID=582737 RepID=A0A061S938_9CHLO
MEGSGQDGIQKLMAAEQEAQRIVNEARKQKSERLKAAKSEAEHEISSFRADCEAEFQKKIAQGGDSSSAQYGQMVQDTDKEIQNIKAESDKLMPKVTDVLVSAVMDVKLV